MRIFEVKVIKNEKEFTGEATVIGKTLTVSSVNLGSRTASTSSNNQFLAKLLLEELIDENQKRMG